MKLNIVMGGPSAEFEVSIKSGMEVVRHCVGRKPFGRIRAVVVTKDVRFYYCDVTDRIPGEKAFANPTRSKLFKGPFTPADAADVWAGCDCAFLALHGSFGEDGRIQGYLDAVGIPYTGSGVFASATAMNKTAAKCIYRAHGLTTPPYSVFGRSYPDVTADTIAREHGFPCFVKCPQSGSSKLMGRAGDRADLDRLLAEFGPLADAILVESAVSGIEFSCAVLDYPDGRCAALPPIEIRPVGSSFFDYRAKYTARASLEICPAPRPEATLEAVKAAALTAHAAIGCAGVSRTDMILDDGTLFVLETNTLPGLTTASLLPKAFAANGGTYEQLVDLLVQTALSPRRKTP